MNKPTLSRSMGFAWLLMAMNAACTAQPAGSLNVPNGNFELDTSSPPGGWRLEDRLRDQGEVRVSTSEGNRYLSLEPNRRNRSAEPFAVGQLLDARSARGSTLQIEAQLGAAGETEAIVGVHVLASNGETGVVQLRQGNNNGNLTPHSATLAVPDNAENIILYAAVTGTSGRGVFDNVSISPRGQAAAVRTTASGELSASVRISSNQYVRTIPASLFGINVEWINNGQGLWSDQSGGLHPQAVELSDALGTRLLRFPGGVFSDYYHWRDGVGPQSDRPVRVHFPNGPESANKFGTDELLSLATAIDADLLITANAGTGTPEEAAAWLRYIRQNAGPVGSQYWEIGNELYMDGDLSGVDISAREYADRFKRFADTLRGVDPDLKIGAIGGLNQGRYSFVKSNNWSRNVLERVAPDMDFFAVHNAYAPVIVGRDSDLDPEQVYMAMLAAPENFAANLEALDALLSRHESSERPISLAVTEWGPLFHFEPGSPWVDHVKTLGSSLLVGSTLHTFLEHPRVEIATAFKLMDYGFMGWIGLDGNTYKATAPYLAFQLYTSAIDGRVLESMTTSPTIDTPAIGTVDAVDDAELLDILAVRQGEDMLVYAVNKSWTDAMRTSITLTGAGPIGEVRVDTLTGAGLDAHTGTAPPQFPGVNWAEQISLGQMEHGSDAAISLTQETISAADLDWTDESGTYRFAPMSITRLHFINVYPND